MEKHVNSLDSERLKVGLKSWPQNTQWKDKIHDKLCRQWRYSNWLGKNWKSNKSLIPQTNYTPQRYYKRRNLCQDWGSMELFWKKQGNTSRKKTKQYFKTDNSPYHSKKQVMDQCVLPTMIYGCHLWYLINNWQTKLRTAQRAMERKMLNLNYMIKYHAQRSGKE